MLRAIGKKNVVITIVTASIAAIGLLAFTTETQGADDGTTDAVVTPAPPPFVCHRKPLNPRLNKKEKRVVYRRVNAWFAHHPNTKKTYPRWKCEVIHQGRIYRQQVAAAIRHRWMLQDRRFTLALKYAARRYHVSYNRLLNCSLSEGLSRPTELWKWNGGKVWPAHVKYMAKPAGSSGAGGWAQFMKSTLDGNAARPAVRNVVPRRYRHWRSKVGQAYTMAYMFSIGQSGQWSGAGCN